MSEASFNKIEAGALAVGRMVHFFTPDRSKQCNGVEVGPYSAVVTQVTGLDSCNLKVFPPFRAPFDEGMVPMFDPVQASDRYWIWPPRV